MHNLSVVPRTISKPLPQRDALAEPHTDGTVRLGYVAFFDLVGHSQMSLTRQSRCIMDLTRIVTSVDEYSQAEDRDELISIATGDGMALVFFGNPLQPVCCTLQIAAILCQYPHLRLRMGIHCGPVLRFRDIHDKENVIGDGINMCERVMDSANEGQILVSGFIAGILKQIDCWADCVEELGEFEVKHSVRLRLFNLRKDGLGRSEVPRAKRVAPESRPFLTRLTDALAVLVA
jgi:class 3 adenylate cyclase